MQIVVCDDGAGLRQGSLGSGIGLRNLRQRIAALYGAQAEFTLSSGADQRTHARLRVPLMLPASADRDPHHG